MQQYFLQEHSQSESTIIVSLAAQNRLITVCPRNRKNSTPRVVPSVLTTASKKQCSNKRFSMSYKTVVWWDAEKGSRLPLDKWRRHWYHNSIRRDDFQHLRHSCSIWAPPDSGTHPGWPDSSKGEREKRWESENFKGRSESADGKKNEQEYEHQHRRDLCNTENFSGVLLPVFGFVG